jgi:hypothetical protein
VIVAVTVKQSNASVPAADAETQGVADGVREGTPEADDWTLTSGVEMGVAAGVALPIVTEGEADPELVVNEHALTAAAIERRALTRAKPCIPRPLAAERITTPMMRGVWCTP